MSSSTATPTVSELEEAREAVDLIIRGSENWADRYKSDTTTFRKLVRMETRLETSVRKYFREAADRYVDYIDWREYEARLEKKAAANTIFLEKPGADVEAEFNSMIEVVFDDMHRTVWVGVEAGERLHKVDSGLNMYSQRITDAARNRTSEMVTNVSDTTKQRISGALQTSIANGEDAKDATKRIHDIVNDSKRAAMIARTESVRTYTQGLLEFGKETGAVGKEWDLSFDPCDLCVAIADASGGVVPLDGDFGSDGGDGPPAHPNCRCGIKLTYDKDELGKDTINDDPSEDDERSMTLGTGKNSIDIPLNRRERDFMSTNGVSAMTKLPGRRGPSGVYGFYEDFSRSIVIRPKTIAETPKQALKTFYHELGHAIDFNAVRTPTKKYERIIHQRNVRDALDKASEYIAVERLVAYGNLKREQAKAFVAGSDDMPQHLKSARGRKYRRYLLRDEEQFADGYAQWRLDPAAFARANPELANIYSEVI